MKELFFYSILLLSIFTSASHIYTVTQQSKHTSENGNESYFTAVRPVYEEEFLKRLSMNHEAILKINGSVVDSIFYDIEKLKHLSLVHGEIRNIDINVLKKLHNLESLTFISNKGNIRLTESTLGKLNKLKELVIHLNNRVILEENVLKTLENLEVLSVDNQTFNDISNETFGHCKKLKYLRWSDGFLGKIDPNAFQNLKDLVSVTLETVKLKNISPFTFSNLPLLNKINLADNKLTVLTGNEFWELPRLRILNLQKNLIVSIGFSYIFKNVPSLKALEISHNKLSCETKLKLSDFSINHNISSLESREIERCMKKNVQIFSG